MDPKWSWGRFYFLLLQMPTSFSRLSEHASCCCGILARGPRTSYSPSRLFPAPVHTCTCGDCASRVRALLVHTTLVVFTHTLLPKVCLRLWPLNSPRKAVQARRQVVFRLLWELKTRQNEDDRQLDTGREICWEIQGSFPLWAEGVLGGRRDSWACFLYCSSLGRKMRKDAMWSVPCRVDPAFHVHISRCFFHSWLHGEERETSGSVERCHDCIYIAP